MQGRRSNIEQILYYECIGGVCIKLFSFLYSAKIIPKC
jgi:hypothetical protein